MLPEDHAKPLAVYKREKLLLDTAALVRSYQTTGKTPEAAIAQKIKEHEALAKAIAPEGPFTHQMAVVFEEQWNAMFPQPTLQYPHPAWMDAASGILTNRVREERHYVALLQSPDFVEEVMEAVSSGKTSQGPALPPEKYDEITEGLVQAQHPTGPEGPAHVMGNAFGQHVLHDILAKSYAKNGPLTVSLTQQLHPHLPDAAPENLLQLANNWLEDRHYAAQAVTIATAPGGVAFQSAIAIAKAHSSSPTAAAQPIPAVQANGATTETVAAITTAPEKALVAEV